MRRHDVGQLLACFAVLVWVSGCGSTDAPSNENGPTVSRPAPSTAQPSAAQRPVYDPPRNFTANRGVAVGPGEAVVGRAQAYSYAESTSGSSGTAIQAIDLLSGDPRWRGPIDARPAGGALRDGPSSTLAVVAGAGGKENLAFTGLRVTPGSGTAQDRREVVVGMLDTTSGTVLWSVQTDLPPEFDVSDSHVLMAGANEHHVVTSVSGTGNLPLSLIVDARTRTAAWTDKGFLAVGVDDTVVLGVRIDDEYGSTGPLQALDMASRAPLWTSQLTVANYEPRLVAPGIIQIPDSRPFESHTYLLNTKNGNQLTDLPDRYQCVFDQRDVVACDANDALVAMESTTMRELWRLPEASSNRVKPTLHTAFHGLVYTEGQRTPVVLDARTGRDAVTDAVIAPDIVIPGFGLAKKDHTLYAYPATG
jgi:outer membrane protein assembly factor BamB